MSANENGWGGGVKTAMIALPVLYFLSIGPAFSIVERGGLQNSKTAEIIFIYFYLPVGVLWDHTPLRGPLEWYLNQWKK